MNENAAEKALLAELRAAQKKANDEWKVALEEEQKGREIDPEEFKRRLLSVRIEIKPEDPNREESDPTCSNLQLPLEGHSGKAFNCWVIGAKVLLVLADRIVVLDYNDLKKPPMKEIFRTELHPKVQFFAFARNVHGANVAGKFDFWLGLVGRRNDLADGTIVAEFKGGTRGHGGYGSRLIRCSFNTATNEITIDTTKCILFANEFFGGCYEYAPDCLLITMLKNETVYKVSEGLTKIEPIAPPN